MGNTPAKESRPRASSYSSSNSGSYPGVDTQPNLGYSYNYGYGRSPGSPFNSYLGESRSRRNTTSSVFGHIVPSRKSKKSEEKDRLREEHYMNLIVKFDESVDGGYLAPYGTYKSNLDFDSEIVRGLIVARRLAPFYTPLQDFDESWSDQELLIIIKQLTLHSIEGAYSGEEEDDDIDNHKIHRSSNFYKRQEQKIKLKMLIEKIKELQKQQEDRYLEAKTSSSVVKSLPSNNLLLRLYRNPVECPICFVFYPDNLNLSRCCLQPICSECFVQIKRLDPHPPHDDPTNANTVKRTTEELPHTLISEPSNCPYCAMTDFGVIFDKNLDFSTGINGIPPHDFEQTNKSTPNVNDNDNESDEQAVMSSSPTSEQEPSIIPTKLRKRRESVPANSPRVITIDQIRPDWESKLLSARSKLARKAAAASAIHASNLIINPETEMAEYDTRRRRNTGSSTQSQQNSRLQTMEERMIEEALRLSIIDEEERKRKEEEKKRKDKSNRDRSFS